MEISNRRIGIRDQGTLINRLAPFYQRKLHLSANGRPIGRIPSPAHCLLVLASVNWCVWRVPCCVTKRAFWYWTRPPQRLTRTLTHASKRPSALISGLSVCLSLSGFGQFVPFSAELSHLDLSPSFSDLSHCTLLTIAHRLHTILDYDRVLVMDAGRVAEFDTPKALLADGQSQFARMAKQAGVITAGAGSEIDPRCADQQRD